MNKNKKKNEKYTKAEQNLLKESKKLIKELVIQLRIQLDDKKKEHNIYALPIIQNNVPQIKPGVYNGIGTLKTTCTGCRERLFAPM